MTLSGLQYTERDVDKAIMANGISFTIALPKKVKDLSKNGWMEIGQLFNGKILLVRS
jgi:spore germination protein YaaH